MERRNLLRTAGLLAAAAVVPSNPMALWARVADGVAPARGLTGAQLSLIAGIADTLIPRTSTPGALDVKVPAFVNVVVSESLTARERKGFIAGLTIVEVYLRDDQGRAFADLPSEGRAARIADIEDQGIVYRAISKVLRQGEPRRTYWKLKELIVHGYFTSDVVANEILGDPIMPGRFDGAAPIAHAVRATHA